MHREVLVDQKFPLRLIAQFRLDPAGSDDDLDDILRRFEEANGTAPVIGTWAQVRVIFELSREDTSLESAIRTDVADLHEFVPLALRSPAEPASPEASGGAQLSGRSAIIDGLISELTAWIETHQLTHIEAADTFDVSLQQIMDICSRNLANLTIDSLVGMLLRVGKDVRLETNPAPRRTFSLADLTSTPPRTDDEIREAIAQGRVAELKPDQA